MAFEIPGHMWSLPAAADLSAAQYRGLVGSLEDGVSVAGAGVDILGVQQNVPFGVVGEAITIMSTGITKMICDGACNDGEVVKIGGSGGAVDGGSSGKGIGIALEDGTTNQIISVRLGDFGTQS